MSDEREIPAVLEAAAQAASSGDLPAAEALLHDVVRLQEASVGPGHADLASTYNNLAVVCEMAGRATDAEQFYRRAYAIASAALDPQDPLVATSFNNLKEFCAARGVPLEVAEKVAALTPDAPKAASAERVAAVAPADVTTEVRPEAAPAQRTTAPMTVSLPDAVRPAAASAAPRQTASSGTVIFGVLATAAVVAVLAVTWPSRETPEPEADTPPATTPVAVAPAPAAPSETPPTAAAPTVPAPQGSSAAPARPAAPRPSPSSGTNPRVLEAKVCQSLSTEGAQWRCVAPSNPANPGRLSFYTRVAASGDVRVRHRWYHGDQLVQDVGLMVRANPSAGYRTYSRQTVNASGGGGWRVEVRTPDGSLLHEERFVVR